MHVASAKAASGHKGPNPGNNDKKGNGIIAKQLQQGPMQVGLSSPAVPWLAKMLQLAGYSTGSPGTTFAPPLATAVSQFQEAMGLPATGVLDLATFQKLEAVQGRIRGIEKLNYKDHYVQGEKSANVARDQRMLSKLGYQVGNTQGIFDGQTLAAERAFRRDDHGMGGRPNDLTPWVSKQLGSDLGALNHVPYFVRAKPSKERTRLDAATALAAAKLNPDGTRGVGAGSSARTIKNVQAHLAAAGFDPKGVNGQWDVRTETALRDFQERAGLPVTGRVDFATWSKLKGAILSARSSTSPAQSLWENDAAVAGTQRELQKLGYKVRTDGLFDKATQRAVDGFERKAHLRVDGKVGAGTQKAIAKALAAQPSALAQRVLKIAQGQIGTVEATGNNDGAVTKYPGYFGRGPESYCADFVSWVYSHAGKSLNYAYCPYLEDHLKAIGHWKGQSNPKPGDLVLFDWNGDGVPDHVGIVKNVNRNGTIETIEGNTENPSTGQQGVWERTRPMSEILGFGVP